MSSQEEFDEEEYNRGFINLVYQSGSIVLSMEVLFGYNVPSRGSYVESTVEEYYERVNMAYVPKMLADLLYYDELRSCTEISIFVKHFLKYSGIIGEQLVDSIIQDPELFMDLLSASREENHSYDGEESYDLCDKSRYEELAARATRVTRTKAAY